MGRQANLRDLVVLCLLQEQPRYGYEIKMIIDHVMAHLIDVSSGSLYYGIKKLEQSGYIEETSVERVGRRPERSVYQLTKSGRKLLEDELPGVIFPKARPFFPLNLALYFFDLIDPQERVRRLLMRLKFLKLSTAFLDELERNYAQAAPRWHLLIIQHQRLYARMEERFLNQVLAELPEASSYSLDTEDLKELDEELELLKQEFNYEIYQESSTSGKPSTK